MSRVTHIRPFLRVSCVREPLSPLSIQHRLSVRQLSTLPSPSSTAALKLSSTSSTTLNLQPSSAAAMVNTRSNSTSSGGQDIVDIITSEHRSIEKQIEQFQNSSNVDDKQQLMWSIIRDLSLHTSGEEIALYPNAKPLGEKAAHESSHGIGEHNELKSILAELDSMKVTDAGYDEKVDKLFKKVKHHHGDEEEDLLPELRKALSHEKLVSLAQQFEDAKKTAVTRPHDKLLPNSFGPFAKLGNLVLGQVDRMRDKMEDRPST